MHISPLARDFVARALTKGAAARPSAGDLMQHGWLKHHFSGKVPSSPGMPSDGTQAGILAQRYDAAAHMA